MPNGFHHRVGRAGLVSDICQRKERCVVSIQRTLGTGSRTLSRGPAETMSKERVGIEVVGFRFDIAVECGAQLDAPLQNSCLWSHHSITDQDLGDEAHRPLDECDGGESSAESKPILALPPRWGSNATKSAG